MECILGRGHWSYTSSRAVGVSPSSAQLTALVPGSVCSAPHLPGGKCLCHYEGSRLGQNAGGRSENLHEMIHEETDSSHLESEIEMQGEVEELKCKRVEKHRLGA